jgi:two-component system CheB/CheR fusion protein
MSTAVSFEQLLGELAQHHKLDLRGYKYSTLMRRTRRRMEQLRIADHRQYLDFITERPGEVNELLHTVLINITKFFRDPAAWEVLRHRVLPNLFARHQPGDTFKIWCAGCSTGEEPYSIALLVAEHLGERLNDLDIKIYGTDEDEHALQIARKGEYRLEVLHGIPTTLRHFVQADSQKFRIDREVRRLVIFGRSNIVTDAPISHVNLLICRNLLIYFDVSAQQRIMNRLQYALHPGGVLFLGKSESQLRSSRYFAPIDTRWRLFERTEVPAPLERPNIMTTTNHEQHLNDRAQQELSLLRLYHNAVLDTLEPGVLIVDQQGVVIRENESARRLWKSDRKFLGGKITESILAEKCPEVVERLEAAQGSDAKTSRFECTGPDGKELAVTVRPIQSDTKDLMGVLIYVEDVSPRENLQHTVEELQATAEELQSSNEELETTNEELQSTNEELETTNEELQSTNEELETTNEELKSLNEELEDINNELGKRSKELDETNSFYKVMLDRMPWPMLLVSSDGRISRYNSGAKEFFGFATPSRDGMSLQELPMSQKNRADLSKNLKIACADGKRMMVDGVSMDTNSGNGKVRVHITPLQHEQSDYGVLVAFEPQGNTSVADAKSAATGDGARRAGNPGNKKATKVNGQKKR